MHKQEITVQEFINACKRGSLGNETCRASLMKEIKNLQVRYPDKYSELGRVIQRRNVSQKTDEEYILTEIFLHVLNKEVQKLQDQNELLESYSNEVKRLKAELKEKNKKITKLKEPTCFYHIKYLAKTSLQIVASFFCFEV